MKKKISDFLLAREKISLLFISELLKYVEREELIADIVSGKISYVQQKERFTNTEITADLYNDNTLFRTEDVRNYFINKLQETSDLVSGTRTLKQIKDLVSAEISSQINIENQKLFAAIKDIFSVLTKIAAVTTGSGYLTLHEVATRLGANYQTCLNKLQKETIGKQSIAYLSFPPLTLVFRKVGKSWKTPVANFNHELAKMSMDTATKIKGAKT